VADGFEDGDDISGCIEGGEFIDQLNDCQLINQ
jgi:hypothetical protein